VKRGALNGVGAGVVVFGLQRASGMKTGPNLARVVKLAGTSAAIGGAAGVVTSGAGRAFKSSARASVGLGLHNRSRAAQNRAKAVVGTKIRSTIRRGR